MTDEQPTNGKMTVDNGAQGRKEVKVNYSGNSNKSKKDPEPKKDAAEKKVVEKVVSGEVVQRKKGVGAKFRDIFTGADLQGVGYFIVHDVVIPAIRNTLADAVTQGTERALFGENRRGPARNTYGGSRDRSYVSYNTIGRNNPAGRAAETDGPRISQHGRAAHRFEEIVLETRGDADQVIEGLATLIQQYDVATVADLYDLVGLSPSYTDDKWGWESMAGSGVARHPRGGFTLDLPETRPLS